MFVMPHVGSTFMPTLIAGAPPGPLLSRLTSRWGFWKELTGALYMILLQAYGAAGNPMP